MNTIVDCPDCGAVNSMSRQRGIYVQSMLLGEILLPEVEPLKCSECGELLLDADAWRVADELQTDRETEAIAKLPIGDFISSKDTYELLNFKSRQAFHKNSRIRSGFVISTKIGDTKFYYKPSVEEFHRSGDGRIRIDATVPSQGTEWFTDVDINWSAKTTAIMIVGVGATATSMAISTHEDFAHTKALLWSIEETDRDEHTDDEQPKAPVELLVARQQ